jgi:hypothetical protein
VIETQARLWNHLLDANRSLWEFYAPWFTSGPSLWNPRCDAAARRGRSEPEQSVDGVPDALETQARSWNHFLDANRSFWTDVHVADAESRLGRRRGRRRPCSQQRRAPTPPERKPRTARAAARARRQALARG